MDIKTFLKKLPTQFVSNVVGLCGREGEEWLADLPRVVRELENRWDIRFDRHFGNLTYNFVGACISKNGTPAVSKIAPPLENPEIFDQAKALEMFCGKRSVRLLSSDQENRAILLERLLPGIHLKDLFESQKEKAVDITISVMQTLYHDSQPNKEFTSVEYWFEKLKEPENGTLPARCLTRARRYLKELNSDEGKIIFLYGDLHHENILSVGEGDFAAINPFGINGSIGYEIGLFLRVHAKWEEDRRLLARAVHKFSDAFGISSREVTRWTYTQQVLSAAWDFEDNGKNWKSDLESAQIWENLRA